MSPNTLFYRFLHPHHPTGCYVREREFQFVDEVEVDDHSSEKSFAPKGNVSSPSPSKFKSECVHPKTGDEIRGVGTVPTRFQICLDAKSWGKITPQKGSKRLRTCWTHVLDDQFSKINHCRVLALKYQHVRPANSRKRNSPYFHAKAKCTFSSCPIVYIFLKKTKPSIKEVFMTVWRHGNICHLKKHTRRRQASNVCSRNIAKKLKGGLSNTFYKLLRKTPRQEIKAGNLTKCLNRDILKAIFYEVRKSLFFWRYF